MIATIFSAVAAVAAVAAIHFARQTAEIARVAETKAEEVSRAESLNRKLRQIDLLAEIVLDIVNVQREDQQHPPDKIGRGTAARIPLLCWRLRVALSTLEALGVDPPPDVENFAKEAPVNVWVIRDHSPTVLEAIDTCAQTLTANETGANSLRV